MGAKPGDPFADEAPVEGFNLRFLKELAPFLRPYRRGFLWAAAVLLTSTVVELLGPWLVRLALDGPIQRASEPEGTLDLGELGWLLGAYGLVTGVGIFLGWWFAMLTAWNGQRVVRDVRSNLFRHLMGLGPTFYERNPAGRLTTRVVADVENLSELITTGVLQTAFDLLKVFGVLAVLAWLSPLLALYAALALPLVAGLGMLFRGAAGRAWQRVRGRLAIQNGFQGEILGGMQTVQAYGAQSAVRNRHADLNQSTTEGWLDTVRCFSRFFGSLDGLTRALGIGLLYWGGHGILDGEISLGRFVQFWLYFELLVEPVRALGERYSVLQAAWASAERIGRILAEPRFPSKPDHPAPWPEDWSTLRFDDMTFHYRDDTPVLTGLNLEIPKGSVTAIVGPTGAGKTTLLSLVSRFRDPVSGSLRLEGPGGPVPLWHLDPDVLRRRVGVVDQDLFLFTGTLLDNLRLGNRAVAESKVWEVLDALGARGLIAERDAGLHTTVGERGHGFSLGERQVLAIARALLSDPEILVLDEATASVDSAAEARLQGALWQAMAGRTALLVAHRLSTVQQADRILVMDQGSILESGTHQELLALGGRYAGMVRAASK